MGGVNLGISLRGKNYDHRLDKVESLLLELARVFIIDATAFALSK
jgi:hypothetical protein